MSSPADDPMICPLCVPAERFARWISDHGETGRCELNANHGDGQAVAPASELAVEVDAFFRETFVPGDYEVHVDDDDRTSHEQRGEPYEEILREELLCDDDVLQAIVRHLPDVDWHDISQGAESLYGSVQNFERLAEIRQREEQDAAEYWYEDRFRREWEEFCDQVQYKSRYFDVEETLHAIFGKAEEYEVGKRRPIYVLEPGQKVFRGRLLDRGLTEGQVRKEPIKELGAPPKDKATAGRMNVEYIPIFYGAFDRKTAVAEIRPGIGEEVAIGEFVSRQPLKVFDFTVFASDRGKLWEDPGLTTRFEFVSEMGDLISKPIQASDRQREYIPTQIVADYLRRFFSCDAVIYRSAMTSNPTADNRNIVVLNQGKPFVGTDGALEYVRMSVERVRSVIYDFAPDPF